jgi:hypothetical protein
MDDLRRSLRGLSSAAAAPRMIGKPARPRRVQGAGGTTCYSYWVDVYVEIDYSLCRNNGEDCADGIGPNTINYGQSIVASILFVQNRLVGMRNSTPPL